MWWLNVVWRLRVLVPWCFHDKIEIKNSVLPWTIPPEEIKSKNVNYSTVLKSFYWKFQREEDKEIDSKRNTVTYVIEKSNVLTFGGVLNFVCVLWIILDITLFSTQTIWLFFTSVHVLLITLYEASNRSRWSFFIKF